MKKMLSLFLVALMLLTVVPMFTITAKAETTPTVYTEGFFSYTVENDEATLVSANKQISGAVVLSSELGGYKLKKIAEKAFYDCKNITSIIIPNTVEVIGVNAFCGCYSLQKVVIGDGVKIIEEYAFNP